MSEHEESAAIMPETMGDGEEHLPPVEPPSAGFIMQLFLIPAIIVAAVIGVWVLFGRLAGGEQDWQQLVVDLGSSNEHRRWRAASGLAHLLNADRARERERLQAFPSEADQPPPKPGLSANPEVARKLVELFTEQLNARKTTPEDITHQEFLARTLGALDVPATVLPALQRGTEPEYSEEVRTSSLASIALVVSRATARGEPVNDPKLVETLIGTATDEAPLIRQFSAYALGLLPTEESLEFLTVMLADADQKTRCNAAIALARNDRSDGLSVFAEVLDLSMETLSDESLRGLSDADRLRKMQEFSIERPMMLQNTLKALNALAPQLEPTEKAEARKRLAPITKSYRRADLRRAAEEVSKVLAG